MKMQTHSTCPICTHPGKELEYGAERKCFDWKDDSIDLPMFTNEYWRFHKSVNRIQVDIEVLSLLLLSLQMYIVSVLLWHFKCIPWSCELLSRCSSHLCFVKCARQKGHIKQSGEKCFIEDRVNIESGTWYLMISGESSSIASCNRWERWIISTPVCNLNFIDLTHICILKDKKS